MHSDLSSPAPRLIQPCRLTIHGRILKMCRALNPFTLVSLCGAGLSSVGLQQEPKVASAKLSFEPLKSSNRQACEGL
jgi:hypothetical protein